MAKEIRFDPTTLDRRDVAAMLATCPENVAEPPSEHAISLWKQLKPRGIEFWEKYYRLVEGKKCDPLFNTDSRYEEWVDD